MNPFSPLPPRHALVASICRCRGRCECGPSESYSAPAPTPAKMPAPGTGYEIERAEPVDGALAGKHIVMRINFKCSYEGVKTMVFLNTTALDALKWKKINPHFRVLPATPLKGDAPPPAARFPSTDEGWLDAISYAKSK